MLGRWVLGAVAAAAMGVGAAAAEYPTRTINFIVPYPPGGPTDVNARQLQPFLEKYLGGSIAVVNKPGAGSEIGVTELARSRPDGYTVGLMASPAFLAITLTRETRYDIDSFDYVGYFAYDPQVFIVHPDSPITDLQMLVDRLRDEPRSITMGMAGIGATPHLAGTLFEQMAGGQFNWIPQPGSAAAMTGVMGRHLDMATQSASTAMGPEREGQIRVLGIMMDERWENTPEWPTFKEQGFDLVFASDRGLAMPKGVPEDILDRWEDALRQTVEDPEYRQMVEREGSILQFRSRAEYTQYLEEQYDTLQDLWATSPWVQD